MLLKKEGVYVVQQKTRYIKGGKMISSQQSRSNSCNQTSTLSNTAEIVENESRFKLSPLQWSKFGRQSVLTSHSAGVSRITKNQPR